MEYSVPVSVSSWIQNAGSVVTLSGQALAGVAIMSQSVSLSGDLVLDLSGLDIYDGMTFTLINASSISGIWDSVDVVGSFTECDQVTVDPEYLSNSVAISVSIVSLCLASIESIVLGIALV